MDAGVWSGVGFGSGAVAGFGSGAVVGFGSGAVAGFGSGAGAGFGSGCCSRFSGLVGSYWATVTVPVVQILGSFFSLEASLLKHPVRIKQNNRRNKIDTLLFHFSTQSSPIN